MISKVDKELAYRGGVCATVTESGVEKIHELVRMFVPEPPWPKELNNRMRVPRELHHAIVGIIRDDLPEYLEVEVEWIDAVTHYYDNYWVQQLHMAAMVKYEKQEGHVSIRMCGHLQYPYYQTYFRRKDF